MNMKNSNMPASPTGDIDTRMSREDFDNKTGGGRYLPSYGLTKREHFAGLAMQGLLTDTKWLSGVHSDHVLSATAKQAASLADALLAELDKEQRSK